MTEQTTDTPVTAVLVRVPCVDEEAAHQFHAHLVAQELDVRGVEGRDVLVPTNRPAFERVISLPHAANYTCGGISGHARECLRVICREIVHDMCTSGDLHITQPLSENRRQMDERQGVVNDLVGGYAVANVDRPLSTFWSERGDAEFVDCVPADLHNAWLDAQPASTTGDRA